MKKKNFFIGIVLKKIPYFVAFIFLTYCLSVLVVKGADFISDAMNKLLAEETVDLENLSITILLLIIISMILAFAKTICGKMFSITIQKTFREAAVRSLSEMQISYIESSSGILITKLTSDIGNLGELFSEIVPEIFQYIVTILTLSVSILIIDFKLLLGIMVCYPMVLFISDKLSKTINVLAQKRRGKYDELTEAAADAISGIIVERAYNLYSILDKRIDRIAQDILKNEYIRNRIQSISYAISNTVKWLPNVICSVLALIEVINGTLTVGELMAFEILFTKIASPISELPFRINDAREMLVSVRRINAIINAPKEMSGTYTLEENFKGQDAISIENVSFWYDSNPNRKILDGLQVTFERGKTTAIVGASGAGKSTLFKILCGFEQPKEGNYMLMGKNFKELDLRSARERIALVTQNVFLFPDTIAENITYGKTVYSEEDIRKACRAACIHDDIISLPDGYETIVGERGANLSGGEKQRIAIARALLKNTPIILMDEPTSALDSNTETVITNALESNALKKTVIVIAHRLSTIINADKIIVLDRGKAVETGTHQELIDKGGIYARLYAKEIIQREGYYEAE